MLRSHLLRIVTHSAAASDFGVLLDQTQVYSGPFPQQSGIDVQHLLGWACTKAKRAKLNGGILEV